MRDIMSNHELSLLKLQLLLCSTLIAELNLIILSYILIGFFLSSTADSGRQDWFCNARWEINGVSVRQREGRMDSAAALAHWEGTLLSQG